jgi:hypothetical protein
MSTIAPINAARFTGSPPVFQHAINNGPKALDLISCFGPLPLNNYYITLPSSKSQPKVLEAVVLLEVAITSAQKTKSCLLQI